MVKSILLAFLLIGSASIAEESNPRILIKGQIFSQDSKTPLAYVNVFPEECNYGTFTNHDGAFELLVHKEDYSKNLVAWMVGYKEQFMPMDTSRTYQIFLSTQSRKSTETLGVSADEIMDNFRTNVRSNYSHNPMVNRVFLREYEKIRDDENLYLNEVIVDYLRHGFFDGKIDQMKLIKGRNKVYDESVAFNYTSGGFNDIQSDVIKYPKDFLTSSKGYTYKLQNVIPGEHSNIFKIRFEAKGKSKYEGYLYIEDKNYALVKAEIDYSEYGRDIVNKLSKKSGFYWDRLTETIVYKLGKSGKYNLSEIISDGVGYSHNLAEQMVVTTEVLVVETDVATFFANEFYDIEEGLSIFEIDFEATPFFWEENNYMVMESSFSEDYN